MTSEDVKYVVVKNNCKNGGDIITWRPTYVLLLALCALFTTLPFAGAVESQNTADNNANTNYVLKKGMNNHNIMEMQKWLKIHGLYEGKIDGYFGPYTEKAVKRFQKKAEIKINGVVGIETIKAMERWGFKIEYTASENPLNENLAKEESKNEDTVKNNVNTVSKQNYDPNYNKKRIHQTTSRHKSNYRSNRGNGDCWDNSAALYNRLTTSGQNARIIQYGTSLSSRHRSVQVYKNGAWVDYDYKGNGYAKTYYATKSKPGMTVIT